MIVVWGGPFPWPSMTGVGGFEPSRSCGTARGNVGGTGGECWLRRECSGWIALSPRRWPGPVLIAFGRTRSTFVSIRGSLAVVVARIRDAEAAAGFTDLAKTCAIPGNARNELRKGNILFWGLFFRQRFPIQPLNRGRIKRALSFAVGSCKGKFCSRD